jgi:mono/diheme cytochrome c family protein
MYAATSSIAGAILTVVVSWTVSGLAVAQQTVRGPLTVSTRIYDKGQLLASYHVSSEQRRGRALWLQRCAFCHDGVGQPTYKTMGSWLSAETIQVLGQDALRAIINTGTEQMPGFRYTLQPQQIDQLIAFLKAVPSDQKPTPEQLARRSSGAAAIARGE